MSKIMDPSQNDARVSELGSYSLKFMWQLRLQAVRAFGPLGFRPTQVLVLEFVNQGHNQPKVLAQLLGLVPPALSTIIAELEGRGLLERQADLKDGRRVRLHLTPEGKETHRALMEAWLDVRREHIAQFSDKELDVSLEFFRKFDED